MNASRFLWILAIVCAVSCAHKQEKADLVVHNARIYLLDNDSTVAQAMAIRDGRVIETGPERTILNKYRADRFYDARRRTIFPGFIDAHGHLLAYGQSLQQVDLSTAASWDEVLSRVSAHHQRDPERKAIIGRGWDQTRWPGGEFPDNAALNRLFPAIPVLLYRIDGHAAIANAYLLEQAGIQITDEIKGGELVKRDGKLTGLLIDNAMEKAVAALPAVSDADREAALLRAGEKLLQYGITTVADAGMDPDVLRVLERLQEEKRFKLQVYAMIMATPENIAFFVKKGPYQTERLSVRSFKFMADGALGSRGACLRHPYADVHPPHYGAMLHDYDFLLESAETLNKAGFQMNTHCIGDSAARVVLGIYARVLGGVNDKRWRIEHAQVMDPEDMVLFRTYSIIPSVQPSHAVSDSPWAELRLGKQRLSGAYAYRTLLVQNQLLALGTDFPIESPDPIRTFYTAIARREMNAQSSAFLPSEALSREEAIRGMTFWAAMACFEENEKGSLEPGKKADFVVLSQDLITIPEHEIPRTFVFATYINGEQVYSYE